jgi:PAS domain S-box-containing protein
MEKRPRPRRTTRKKQATGKLTSGQRGADDTSSPGSIYRTLFERSPTILYVVAPRPDGRYVFDEVNPAAYRLTGFKRDEILGKTPREVFPAVPATLMESKYEECCRTGETVEYDVEGDSPIGYVSRHTILVPLKAADGTVHLIFGTSIDTTLARRLEQQLRQAQKMEAVGKLTSGIAHEFNNILTAVIGNLELLPEPLLAADERAARRVGAARRAAERAARLTAQLLAFSRKQRMLPQPTDLNRVVTSAKSLLESTIVETIRIETTLSDGLWLALADPNQVELALLNLALNARDAMNSTGTINIRTANIVLDDPKRPEEPPPGEYVMVSLTDAGSGIPAEILDRVFEPFFTTKQLGERSGLGLSQVLGVAQQLGGGVRIKTAVGAGTTVSLYLPRAA